MHKGQKLDPNSQRLKLASEFWLRVATDVRAGLNAQEICERYINPRTSRDYQLTHIHWIIRQLKSRKIN